MPRHIGPKLRRPSRPLVILGAGTAAIVLLMSFTPGHRNDPQRVVTAKKLHLATPTPSATPEDSPAVLSGSATPAPTPAKQRVVTRTVTPLPTPTPDTSKANVEATPAATPATTVTPEPTPSVTPEATPDVTPEPTATPIPMDPADFCRLSQLVDQAPACPLSQD